ncbi:MAG: hypothetical protein VYA71_03555 [Pseudomonadota bacterium]|nr:hypothetical protein [Pseudomonadota bacterium]
MAVAMVVVMAETASLAAQETVPLDIVPLPASESVEIEVLDDGSVAAQPAAATGAEDTEVEVGAVDAPDPEAAGLIEEANGGFAFDMWAGSDRRLVEHLLARLPVGVTSRTVNSLARRLLQSAAAAPKGPATVNLLALRIERLAIMGDGVAVNHMMRAAPADLDDITLAQTRLDALLLTADFVGACAQARELIRHDDLPYWEKVLIFCQALNAKHATAAFGVELLRERGVDDDPALESLLVALAGADDIVLDSLPNPTALHLAMLRTARLAVPEDAITNADASISRAIALTATVPLDLRLRAAERAEALGSLPTETLAELYDSVPFTSEELSDPWPRVKGHKDALSRALLYQAAQIQVVPAARAEVLRAAWMLGAESGGWDGFATAARLTLDDLLGLRPLPELVWIAGDAARALLAARRPDAAGPWIDLAKTQAGINADAARAVAELAPIIGFVDAGGVQAWDGERFTTWWESQGEDAGRDRHARAILLYALLVAFDRHPPTEALLALLERPDPVWVRTPPEALLRQLNHAAAAGRVGETVLLALTVLDSSAAGVPGHMALGAVVGALYQIGLEADARALAIETLLAREF